MFFNLQVIAGGIGIDAYVILLIRIINTGIQQNFAAFMLWTALDSIVTVTTMIERGNFWLPLSNVIGSGVIAVLMYTKHAITWSKIETVTTLLVIICLMVWFVAGSEAGIITSSLAVFIASVPQMVDTYKNPKATPVSVYLIFLLANVISFFAGKNWTIEERFYPGSSIALCVVIVLFSLRKNQSI